MTSYHTLKTAMAAIVAAGTLGAVAIHPSPAVAAEQRPRTDDASEYAKLNGGKIGLAEAIATAERQFGGKAVNAALDTEQASAAFEVELMTATGSQTVAVDGQTGAVSKVADATEGTSGEDAE